MAITKQAIQHAHDIIHPFVHHTPVLTSHSLNDAAGCRIFFKCENFQNIGAFKARGAMNAVLQLPEEIRENGIATHSSGNHAQAVARAAKLTGVKAFIVMPRNAPQIKKNGVLGFGGEVFECEPNLRSREVTLAAVIMKTKATEIHPFNNEKVIAGQATAAKELFAEISGLEAVLAPIGGGGLLSGTALAAKYFSPETEVFGSEPEGADDAYRSLASGKIEPSQANTIADGLLTSLCPLTFGIIRKNVKAILTVNDEEIAAAMRLLWERLKIVVEPSGAVPFASVLKYQQKFKGKKIGIILSGGNVDLEVALRLMTKAPSVVH